MEWNKIDRSWKESLAEREVTPSANAWDKLSAQLDKHAEGEKKSNLKIWIGIAASLLIGGFSVMHFISPSSGNHVMPTLELPSIERIVVAQEPTEMNRAENKEVIEQIISEAPQKKGNLLKEKHRQLAKNNIVEDTISTLKPESLKVVFTEPVVNKTAKRIVVSSEDLLNQVEGEIEVEYRESVIKKVFDKTKKVIVEISK